MPASADEAGWLLLLHQIPPNPPYFRAQVLRRLNQLGAMAIKNSAYVLPNNDETEEDFEWLRSEIVHDGGEAWLFRAELLGGLTNGEIRDAFRKLRAADYLQLLEFAAAILDSIRQSGQDPDRHQADWRKLNRRFEEARRIDFFEAAEGKDLEAMIKTIASKLRPTEAQPARPGRDDLAGKTWVTRKGVKVDRIATAWLIRRFIDPQAAFRFVEPAGFVPAPGEVRFDMFDGEFTHEGPLCSFEVLARHAGIEEPAIEAIGQMVHDIDWKDARYQRPETSGFAAMITGITALHASDELRVEEGSRLLDAVRAAFQPGT